jgi:hypothetical protein
MSALIGQGNLADLAIDNLRLTKRWDFLGEITAAFDKPSHSTPLVRRKIVHYALECPNEAATRFIEQIRKSDPELVASLERLISKSNSAD